MRSSEAHFHRTLWPLVAVGMAVAALLTGAPANIVSAQATAELQESTECPTMTDSIDRLYLAYFNRDPDAAEFRDAGNRYRSGMTSLEGLAEELARSSEFRTRYGTLDSERYVELVYRNVLRRDPSADDRDFWITNLESGYARGAMMVAFSESEEFVRRTSTAIPLAGFLRWYPEGTHWYCGVGPRSELDIKPLTEPTLYADFLFQNNSSTQSPVGFVTLIDAAPHVTIAEGSLPPGFTEYKWGGLFGGDGNYGSAMAVRVGPNTSWIAVFYPTSIGEQRLGWQLDS